MGDSVHTDYRSSFFIDPRVPGPTRRAKTPHKSQSFFSYTLKSISIPAVVSSAIPIIMASLAVYEKYPVVVIIVYVLSSILLLFYYINQYKKYLSNNGHGKGAFNSSSRVKKDKIKFRAFVLSLVIFISALGIKIALHLLTDDSHAEDSTISSPPLNDITVGDIVSFGEYFQDSLTKTDPIDWIILDVKDDSMLVISKKCLDCKQFNGVSFSNYWDTSTIRQWLQSEFVNIAFSQEMQAKIIPTNTDINTVDTVFLLSTEEAERYFINSKAREAVPTLYAVDHGAGRDSDLTGGSGWWWLRSPGTKSGCVADIRSGGAINYEGYKVNAVTFSVRPALWIDTSILSITET